jgi:group I intron endonuclease
MSDQEWSTGAYCIHNRVNGKRYVGGAYKSFRGRIRGHKSSLKAGHHFNRHLQSAWNYYGPGAFVFVILEKCPPDKVQMCEQYWINYYNAANRAHGYNCSPTACSTLGYKYSPEACAKISKAKANTSEETRSKMSASHIGLKHSPEARANMSASKKIAGALGKLSGAKVLGGVRHSEGRRQKQSTAMLGNQNGKAAKGKKKVHLTDVQRQDVIAMYQTGKYSLGCLAKIFVVASSTIGKILTKANVPTIKHIKE